MAGDERDRELSRRKLIADGARAVGLLAAAGALGSFAAAGAREDMVWQIDPDKCIACGNCATACVLTPSAVRCVHDVPICGYCDLCFGYFAEQRPSDSEAAENLRCPTDAIIRNFVEEPYYEYLIDEPKCIGCGVCVEGCSQYGNGALILQVRHDRCKNCNECAIAVTCPADAFVRVPAGDPYLLRSARLEEEGDLEEELAETGPRPTRPMQPQQQATPAEPAPPMRQPTRPEPEPGSAEQPVTGGPAQPETVLPADDLSGGGLQPVTPRGPEARTGPPPPPDAADEQADDLGSILGVDSI